MATWTAPIDTETDPDAPLLSSLGKRWDNNVIAAFEGAFGAPYASTSWHPYNGVTVGDGNDGVIYDHAVDGTVAQVDTPDFEDGYEYRIYCDANNVGDGSYVIQLYKETDAAWQTADSISIAATDRDSVTLDFIVSVPRLSSNHHIISGMISAEGSLGTTTGILGGVYDVTVQKILRARLNPAFNYNSGKIYMFRREVKGI